MQSRVEILIAGAGLAGLSSAYFVSRRAECRIVEADSRPGGLATTDTVKGFRFDKTGHLLHLRDPYIRGWIKALMGGNLMLISRKSRIYSHGVYTRYPFQSNTYGLPKDVAIECIVGFIKAREKKIKANSRPKNFLEFIYYNFGEGFAKHFMIPYNRKIWGVHPRQMSIEWCDRFVPLPRLEDVISGAIGLGSRQLGYNVNFFYPPEGIGKLPERIASALSGRVEIEYEKRLVSVNLKKREAVLATGEKIRYEKLISTIPLKSFFKIAEPVPAKVKKMADLLKCNKIYYINIALKKPPLVDFHWCYVPSPRIPFYRVGAYSNFSTELVPTGCGSLYVELSSRRKPVLSRIFPSVVTHLERMKIVEDRSDVIFSQLRVIPNGYVVYDFNYRKVVDGLHDFLAKFDVYSIGRYGRWNYSSMEDAIIMGRGAVAEIFSSKNKRG